MIESIVAMSLVLVGMLGILTLVARSSHLSVNATDDLTASYLASEGIEVVKNILDTEYVSGKAFAADFQFGQNYTVSYNTLLPNSDPTIGDEMVYYDPSTHLYAQQPDASNESVPTIYSRLITASQVSADALRVDSIVTWTQDGTSHKVDLEDIFMNWR